MGLTIKFAVKDGETSLTDALILSFMAVVLKSEKRHIQTVQTQIRLEGASDQGFHCLQF